MTWMCPKCKGMDLKVDIVIHTRARPHKRRTATSKRTRTAATTSGTTTA